MHAGLLFSFGVLNWWCWKGAAYASLLFSVMEIAYRIFEMYLYIAGQTVLCRIVLSLSFSSSSYTDPSVTENLIKKRGRSFWKPSRHISKDRCCQELQAGLSPTRPANRLWTHDASKRKVMELARSHPLPGRAPGNSTSTGELRQDSPRLALRRCSRPR